MPTPTPTRAARPWPRLLALLSLLVLAGAAGTTLGRWLRQAPPPAAAEGPDLPDRLCKGWPRPDLALVISGEQHGYLLPCGCSRPQLGGLERRYNFLQKLRAIGWPVAAVDLGDVPQHEAPAHLANVLARPKYLTSMQAASRKWATAAVGIGRLRDRASAGDGGRRLRPEQRRPPYLLAANLDERTRNNNGGVIEAWKLVEPPGSGLKVGITAIVGPTVRGAVKDKDIQFTATTDAVPGVLKEMDAAHVDLRVMLYHGSANQKNVGDWPPQAISCARNYPQFQIVVCLSDDDLAPSEPKWVDHGAGKGRTLVTSLGHKGKSVGIVGIYRGKPGEPIGLRYQLADMTESFMTPEGKDADNPILALMEDYTRELKETQAVSKYPQSKHPLQLVEGDKFPEYVGSDTCKTCHAKAYDVWSHTGHSHAFKTLEDAKRPSLRRYDPECVVCHTVGFGRLTGYKDKQTTPDLIDVGCESCHGPAGWHVDNYKDPVWQRKLNPWKAPPTETEEAKVKRLDRIDQMCQACHDVDNDVHWVGDGFKRGWPKVEHPTPPRKP